MNASGSSEGFLGYRAGSYDVTFSLRKGFCLVRHRDYVIKACDTCDMTCEHVSRQGELWPFFPCALDLSVSVGFLPPISNNIWPDKDWAICCDLNYKSNTTLNRLGFADLWFQSRQTHGRTDCSVVIQSNTVGNRWKKIHIKRVCLNQGTANHVNTVDSIHLGKYSNQSHGVCSR